jgi:hypothetical protein
MSRRVLLDRDLTRAWLDMAMTVAATQPEVEEARVELHRRLENSGLGEAARTKTVTALVRSWYTPDPLLQPLVSWAAQQSHVLADSRPLHMGVLLATQPFFADQIAIVGRILAVQDDVETPTVRSRMKAVWGPRKAVDNAVQRTIKTMRSLGMLEGSPSESLSQRAAPISVEPKVAGWLAACLLRARGADAISSTELAAAPELCYVDMPTLTAGSNPWLMRHSEGAGRTVLTLAQ